MSKVEGLSPYDRLDDLHLVSLGRVGKPGNRPFVIQHHPEDKAFIIGDTERGLYYTVTPEGLTNMRNENGEIDVPEGQRQIGAEKLVEEIELLYQPAR